MPLLSGPGPEERPCAFLLRGEAAVSEGGASTTRWVHGPALLTLPALVYTPPGGSRVSPAELLLKGHRRVHLYPRSACRLEDVVTRILQGSVILESPQVQAQVSTGEAVLGRMRGRLLVRAGYPGGEPGGLLVVLDGELQVADRLLSPGRAVQLDRGGKRERRPGAARAVAI